MTAISMNENDLVFYSQYHWDLSNASVDELLVQYKDNPILLSQILIAKTEEDKKRVAEELRLTEEARLKMKYLEYELGQFTQPYDSNLNSSIPLFNSSSTGVELPQVEYTSHPAPRPQKIQKHRRTLSYESVLTLKDTKTSPTPTPKVLNHEKVMEALRAKLRRSSSSTSSGYKKSSPELPNTYPTTGVLLLNLRNRQNKLSVSRRKS
ncbi:hypothetical protein K501DRAFT_309751 [Backusella circina FSU 941]|nr:hypothetical protein K501DRAFT_309751 [Backusella circina FSU 941]